MHAGPLITTPSALLLFSSFVSPVLSSCLTSFILFYALFPSPLLFPPFSGFSVSFCLSTLSLYLPVFSPALLLTSSAVLRPLHEANAHSGLAVAACMRSTGGPIKRRQEQEMERETGSARPQGPRRYHNCPPLMSPQRCLSQNHLRPPSSLLPSLTSCVSSAQAVLKLTSGLLCVCPLGAGCLKTPQHPHVYVFSCGCPPKSQNPCFCNRTQHCTLTSCCMCVCVSECVCVSKHTHLTIYSNFLSPLCLSVCCSAVKNLLCWGVVCVAIRNTKRETLLLSAFSVLHCFLSLLCCSL